jgi:hypothetical protein
LNSRPFELSIGGNGEQYGDVERPTTGAKRLSEEDREILDSADPEAVRKVIDVFRENEGVTLWGLLKVLRKERCS